LTTLSSTVTKTCDGTETRDESTTRGVAQPRTVDNTHSDAKTHRYPVFLDLNDRRCVVVGGGSIAQGKVEALLDAGALVHVISPELSPGLVAMTEFGCISHAPRRFQPGDLADAYLVVAACDDRTVNEQVRQESSERNILVNVVDEAASSSFIAPSIIRRGDLTIAVSTAGKAPALAVRLRERLERMIGQEYGRFLQIVGGIRDVVAKKHPEFGPRKTLWYDLVDSDALEQLRNNNEPAARETIERIMGVALENSDGEK
jgi:siroheme synthase-like protein